MSYISGMEYGDGTMIIKFWIEGDREITREGDRE